MGKIKVTLEKSTIGCTQDMIDTVRALGLKKIRSTAEHEDTPSIRGMLFKVKHLIKVQEN
jgi:large subunit ribosomal protein L30